MGKGLVIRSADFSEAGFKLEYEKLVITSLYNAKDQLITDWGSQTAAELGLYYYENDNHELVKAGNLSGAASTKLIDVEDYSQASVYTKNEIGTTGSIVLGVAVMVFLDANNNITGGISTASEGIDTITKGVGAVGEMTEFSMQIPQGSKYVVCSFIDDHNSLSFKDFVLTLSKLK